MRELIAVLVVSVFVFSGCQKKDSEQSASHLPQTAPTEAVKPPMASEQSTSTDGATTFKSKCATCHGSDAMGRADFPRLAGQSKEEIVKKLKGYQDGSYGKAMAGVMAPNAKLLSREQMEALAAYLSSLK